MNEFEWRRQLRDLHQPLTPQRDLWVAIDAALDATDAARATAIPEQRPARPLRWLLASGLAASLLLAGALGWHALRHAPAAAALASTATTPWKPADPRLAGAAIELDAAHMELQLAIQQAPDSPALQRLLDRTEHQQMQLRQLAGHAG
ncbi:hypothetical protein B0E46_02080 [Rhodanobacter sp. B04]|uniref:hypothetical protein n=1 Tax=Rhodanobacter sp. B04 TaxID=1945860 RepID=UPI0009878C0B|nr:hypothetical protein [Rhodanobacter sp. B04]OOG66287.1 hypothetical protein B0E46_02080 [Rhodanobacter sp. B04]